MARYKRTLNQVLSGLADSNVSFDDLCTLMVRLGFVERIRGDHHIFSRVGIAEILNLQPRGDKAKTYQVRQVRNVIVRYNLSRNLSDGAN
jgi:hypothetical protein